MLNVIVRVFLFILRLRFPPHLSVFSVIRNRYGIQVTRNLRKWERSACKAAKLELDDELLRRCYSESVVPKFLKFRLYRQNLRHTPAYAEVVDILLRNEIDYKKKLCKKEVIKLREFEESCMLPGLDLSCWVVWLSPLLLTLLVF